MVVSTDRPTRSSLAKGWPGVTTILTGNRCTILVKLPVALLGAMGAKAAPEAGGTPIHCALELDVVGVHMDGYGLAAADVQQIHLAIVRFDIDLVERHNGH